MRNRLIASLSRTLIVAQARHRSGALNSATWAADMNRDVYAAPGDNNKPYNTGCNALIAEGKATSFPAISIESKYGTTTPSYFIF